MANPNSSMSLLASSTDHCNSIARPLSMMGVTIKSWSTPSRRDVSRMKLPKGVTLASHRHRRSLASSVNRDGQISVMIALWPKECGYGCKDFLVQLGGRVAELH